MLEDSSQWLAILKTFGSLAAVLAVIYILAVAAKKYLRPERWGGLSTGESIQIVQTFAIGPKQKLIVIDVEEKRLLLGVGGESIQSLAILREGTSIQGNDLPESAKKVPHVI